MTTITRNIDDDFRDSIDTVIGICDLLTTTTAREGALDEITDNSMYSLAYRCLTEAGKAKRLFDEQQEQMAAEILKLREQLEECQKPPERSELETQCNVYEHTMRIANESLQRISELMAQREGQS